MQEYSLYGSFHLTWIPMEDTLTQLHKELAQLMAEKNVLLKLLAALEAESER